MQNANPAGVDGGHRKIIITGWKPCIKHTLRGFFSARLPNGMSLNHLRLHQRGAARWVELPAEFCGRAAAADLRSALLFALSRNLEAL